MTLSTKPEVYNLLHYVQRRTEPRPQITCTEKFVKFGHAVFEHCEQTDTDRRIDATQGGGQGDMTQRLGLET